MAEVTQQFGNILLGGRSGTSQGQLRISETGLAWRKSGGGKTVEVPSKDIQSLLWTKVARGCQLSVRRQSGQTINFIGFRDKDLELLQESFDKDIEEQELAVSGRNWGDALIDGSTLVFKVNGKPAFRVPLNEVGQVAQGRDEVMLEFPVDDHAGGERDDALVEMGFYVPKDTEQYPGNEETPAAKVFYDRVMEHTEVVASGDAIASFEAVAVLAPRGRFEVEMYSTFMKLVGQSQDYVVQYDSIVRLFVLPKNPPHTLVVVSLDPPIRKGQTYYPHILCQFSAEEDTTVELDITEDLLAAKNEKCGGKLQKSMDGPSFDVFARTLRGLSSAKLTKPGAFRTADGVGYALRCSFKADDGYLYPLERAFFYVHKPPTLLVHDEIESVEFMRQGGGVLAASAKTFDLNIRLKNEQEYLFRGIQKSEWTNLFNFIHAKKLRVENLREAEMGPGGGGRAIDLDLGEDIDTGMAKMQAAGELEDSEEDADFQMGSGDEEDDGEASDDSGSASEGEEVAEPAAKKVKKRAAASPGAAPKPKKAKKMAPPDSEAQGKPKAKRKKKDKNAPKKGLSAFMFFSSGMREQVKAENPGIAFGEIGKVMGEKWKQVSPEERAKYEQMAANDKERYARDMEAYKEKQAAEGRNLGAESG
ncbi:hypothetical protein WJX72_005220 [[Myrmecia] bisecta]|uniref:FACT complex subunit SSRP1 n=1 Tax=[Myrmecia] bisecta TaxID=41462 RepID=A0AAW1PT06_9CHLO